MKFPANAIAVGMHGANKGKIIGACGMFNMIKIMDPDTGEICRTYSLPDFPVKGCDDVSEGPDGTLYWSNAGFGTIGYVKPDGTTGEIEGLPFINSIAVSRDAKWLWYGACIGKDQLWRVELGDDGLPKKGAKPELIQDQPGWSNSMDASSDGYIYAPTNMYGEVRRIHPATGEVEKVWEGLEFPSAIDVNDATGMIYSTEFHLGNITKVDLKNQTMRVLAKFPPCTDNVACSDDTEIPRIFGSSFVADLIMEISEFGDLPRVVSIGGLHYESIQCIGNQVFIKDMGRVMEYFPRTGKHESFAWGNFWDFADGKSHDWGGKYPDGKRYDPERITWTKSVVNDMCNGVFGKVGRLTPDNKSLIIAGGMAELAPNRLIVMDLESRQPTRDIYDLPHLNDAVQVGDDLYLIAEQIPKNLRGPEMNGPNSTYVADPKPSAEGLMTESWEILRIDKNGNRKSVYQNAGLSCFAQKDGDTYVSDTAAGEILQVAKGGKWLDEPVRIAGDLKNPEGIAVGIDGNLLVMEANEDDPHNGRLSSVDPKTGNSTVLFAPLGISHKLNPEMFMVLATSKGVVGQTDDGAIYMYEPGYMNFSVLEPR
jgi:hypothetical protein